VIPQYQIPPPQYQPVAPAPTPIAPSVGSDLLGGLGDALASMTGAADDLSVATATASQVQRAVQSAVEEIPVAIPAWPVGPHQPVVPVIPWLPQLPAPAPSVVPAVSLPTPASIVQQVGSILSEVGFGPETPVFRVDLPPLPRAVARRAAVPRVTSLRAAPAPVARAVTPVAPPSDDEAARPRVHSVQPHASAAPASSQDRSPRRAPGEPAPRGPGDGMGAIEAGGGLGGLLLPTIAALLGACLLLPPRRFRRPVGRRARLPQQPRAERRDRPG
jgi:hypothetical protein